jgi:hypothetical protein
MKYSTKQSSGKSSEKHSSNKNSLWEWEEVRFHCSSEWHFASMTSHFAPILHSWGRRLSSKLESFYPAVDNIGRHFGRDRTTVMRALEELVECGWAEVIHKEPGKPVTYRFVSHKEWARNHPDDCVVKDSMPWEGEGDPLAQQLHVVSGGLAKFHPNQMNGLRKSEWPDNEIVTEFRVFLDRNPQQGRSWKSVYHRFRRHLLRVAADLRKAASAKNSSSEVSRGSDTYPSRGSDTPRRVEATPTSRTGATQVVEVESPKELTRRADDTAPLSRERFAVLPANEIHGRGKPPSKPSPQEKTPVDAELETVMRENLAEQKRRLFEKYPEAAARVEVLCVPKTPLTFAPLQRPQVVETTVAGKMG